MTGPVLRIDLANSVDGDRLKELASLLKELSERFEEQHTGSFEVGIEPRKLGIVDSDDAARSCWAATAAFRLVK